MGNRDLPDIYTLALGPAALGLRYIYQANPSCPCYNLYILLYTQYIYFDIHVAHYCIPIVNQLCNGIFNGNGNVMPCVAGYIT